MIDEDDYVILEKQAPRYTILQEMVMHNGLFDVQNPHQRYDFNDRNFYQRSKISEHQKQSSDQQVEQLHHNQNYAGEIYETTLWPGELSVKIIEEGEPIYAKKGQFIKVIENIHYEGETYYLKRGQNTYVYGRKKNSVGVQLFFGFARSGMKAKVEFGPELTKKFQVPIAMRIPNKRIHAEYKIVSIEQFPSSKALAELILFYEDIIDYSYAADEAFCNHQYQKSLTIYEVLIDKIFSKYFIETMILLNNRNINNKTIYDPLEEKKKMNTEKQLLEVPQRDYHNMILQEKMQPQSPKKSKFDPFEKEREKLVARQKKVLQKIQQDTEHISVKAIQVAFLTQEYFKTIKWAGSFLLNPRCNQNIKVLLTRIRCYYYLEEYQRAIEQLKIIKLIDPQNSFIEKQFKEVEQAMKEKAKRVVTQREKILEVKDYQKIIEKRDKIRPKDKIKLIDRRQVQSRHRPNYQLFYD